MKSDTVPEHWKNTSLKNIKGEKWRDCIFEDTDGKKYDFGGLYMVSNYGRVKSLDRTKKSSQGCTTKIYSRIYTPENLNKTGYLRVRLIKEGVAKAFLVHRLVMLCFADKIHGKKKVNHKRGIKWDNRLKMLEWTTHSENIQHAFDIGLHKGYKGEESPSAKITDKIALAIFNAQGTQHQIAKKFNVTRALVCAIRRGCSWSHITGKVKVRQRFPLSNKDIMNIRMSTESVTALAKSYGKSRQLIRKIKNGIQ